MSPEDLEPFPIEPQEPGKLSTDEPRDTELSPPPDSQADRDTIPPPPPDAEPTLAAVLLEVRYGNELTKRARAETLRMLGEQARIHERLDEGTKEFNDHGERLQALERNRCAVAKAGREALASEPDEAARRRWLPVIQLLEQPCGPVKKAIDSTKE